MCTPAHKGGRTRKQTSSKHSPFPQGRGANEGVSVAGVLFLLFLSGWRECWLPPICLLSLPSCIAFLSLLALPCVCFSVLAYGHVCVSGFLCRGLFLSSCSLYSYPLVCASPPPRRAVWCYLARVCVCVCVECCFCGASVTTSPLILSSTSLLCVWVGVRDAPSGANNRGQKATITHAHTDYVKKEIRSTFGHASYKQTLMTDR